MTTLSEIQALRSGLTMGRCSLLRHVTTNIGNKDFKSTFASLANKVFDKQEYLQFLLDGDKTADLFQLAKTRIALVNAFCNDGDLEQAIADYVLAVQRAWRHETVPCVANIEKEIAKNFGPGWRPSFLPLSTEIIDSTSIETALKNVATTYGWSHPGVLIAGETLAILCGVRRDTELTVKSKIMFAAGTRGILANIAIERIDGGCGLLIPDPLLCGYLWMDQSF